MPLQFKFKPNKINMDNNNLVALRQHIPSVLQQNNTATLVVNATSTILEAIHSDTPSLAVLKKDYGKNAILAFLTVNLIELNSLAGVKNKMDSNMIKIIAMEIAKQFYFFKLADIGFIFKRIIMGEYGKMYERISPAFLMDCFSKYKEERINISYNESLTEHDNQKDSCSSELKRVMPPMDSKYNPCDRILKKFIGTAKQNENSNNNTKRQILSNEELIKKFPHLQKVKIRSVKHKTNRNYIGNDTYKCPKCHAKDIAEYQKKCNSCNILLDWI